VASVHVVFLDLFQMTLYDDRHDKEEEFVNLKTPRCIGRRRQSKVS
jgi:hypothetical protein